MESGSRPSKPVLSRRARFFASYVWLILKNVIGWSLILAAFIAGPLVPGPGGIPLFLIGFALVNFPGKRKLTARILRGVPIGFQTRGFSLILLGISALLSVSALLVSRKWRGWPGAEPWAISAFFLAATGAAWLMLNLLLRLLNLLVRNIPKVRRPIRHWLRGRHIRLLPPRWRRRLPHERGSGPQHLGDEILKLGRQR